MQLVEAAKICQNWGVDNRLREGWWEVLETYFTYFKKHSICMSPNEFLYLGHGVVNDRPTSLAARKEKCGIRVLAGTNRKPNICSSCDEVLALTLLLFSKLVGVAWFAVARFLCFYNLLER